MWLEIHLKTLKISQNLYVIIKIKNNKYISTSSFLREILKSYTFLELKNTHKILQSKEKNSYYKSFSRKSFSNKFISCNLRTLNWRTCIEKQLEESALPGLIFFHFYCSRSSKQEETPIQGRKLPIQIIGIGTLMSSADSPSDSK